MKSPSSPFFDRIVFFMKCYGKFIHSIQAIVISLLIGLPMLSHAAIKDETALLLQQLTNAPGASGFEDPVREILIPIWKQHLSSLDVDGVGNLIGLVPGANLSPKVLLMAHMDEVGFMVRNITKEGFIEVEPLGGGQDHTTFAERWTIMTAKGPLTGYSGIESGHLVPHADQGTGPSLLAVRDLVIDVGARSKEEAINQFGLRPGLPITPATPFVMLNGTGRYLAKAFDDRVGLAVITDVIKQIGTIKRSNQIMVAATVQEEIGLRGARVIFNSIKPDVVINIEACMAGDFPLRKTPSGSYPSLGQGPCLYVHDKTMLPNNKLVEWIINLAEKNHIPYQFAVGLNYGQDGSALQASGRGIPVINIGIPVRYAHQQSGLMQRSDYDALVRLINVIIANLDAGQMKQIQYSLIKQG
jgi:putative aminopeptidase FrvX